MLGSKLGAGNASVDGFLIDDWWTLDGPTESSHFHRATGLAHNGPEIAEIYSNWSITTVQSLQALAAAGKFTWNDVNCELDDNPGEHRQRRDNLAHDSPLSAALLDRRSHSCFVLYCRLRRSGREYGTVRSDQDRRLPPGGQRQRGASEGQSH
jgi:hypothetical protein